MALSKPNRLRSNQDFTAVYRKGIRRKSTHLTLLAIRQASLRARKQPIFKAAADAVATAPGSPTRIGISISQKVSKRAVVRNRIKRQLRAAARQLLPRFSQGWDVVVVVQPQATQCDYHQFLQELEQLLMDAEVCDGH